MKLQLQQKGTLSLENCTNSNWQRTDSTLELASSFSFIAVILEKQGIYK